MKNISHNAECQAYREGIDFALEGMGTYGNGQRYQNIRMELGGFLLDLHRSRNIESVEKQKHYLFLALRRLDKLEYEIKMSTENEDTIPMKMIHEKIITLKIMISEYIHQLSEG